MTVGYAKVCRLLSVNLAFKFMSLVGRQPSLRTSTLRKHSKQIPSWNKRIAFLNVSYVVSNPQISHVPTACLYFLEILLFPCVICYTSNN